MQPPHLLITLLLALLTLPLPAQARKGDRGGAGLSHSVSTTEGASPGVVEERSAEITPSGLTPLFPEDHRCVQISSPFASPFRYDGSLRRDDRNSGRHGGMDLSLPEGTPLLAVANGTVIAKGTGGRLEGIYLWLTHSPNDTGLPFWCYTKYQHLTELPPLNEGDRVSAGQPIALSGKTGTTGGHYGSEGYPHLHLSIFVGPSDQFDRAGIYGSMIKARDARPVDPLTIYLPGLKDLADLATLSEEQKQVKIPFIDDNTAIHPDGSKVIWPVTCPR